MQSLFDNIIRELFSWQTSNNSSVEFVTAITARARQTFFQSVAHNFGKYRESCPQYSRARFQQKKPKTVIIMLCKQNAFSRQIYGIK
jgi:hypothetical protein